MKFIDCNEIEEINLFLNHKNVGMLTLVGRIEAFDFTDEVQFKNENTSDDEACISNGRKRSNSFSSGSYSIKKNQRKRSTSLGDDPNNGGPIFLQLVATMHEIFPDYDFTNIKSHQFPYQNINHVIRHVNSYFAEISESNPNFLKKLWETLDYVVNIYNCDVFTYVPRLDDHFSEALWSFNFFFFNKESFRIGYLTCSAKR